MSYYLDLQKLSSYKISFNLSNLVWKYTLSWDYFAKDTIGKQFVRAVDSISANMAEGFGRYSKKDKIKFYRYSFGSLKESIDWNSKARDRELLSDNEWAIVNKELQTLPKEINSLIKYTNTKLQH